MKRWLVLGVVLVAIIALVGWRLVQKKEVDKQAKDAAQLRTTGPVAVAIGVAGPRAIAQTLDAVGVIQSPYTVKISPKIQGLIDYLQVREGDPVKAGQVLVKLDPDTLTATVLQNVANVAQAKQRYEQARFTQGSTNVQLSTTIQQAKAAVDQAQTNLNVTVQNVGARVSAAKAAVTDGDAKIAQNKAGVASAQATVESAQATLKNAQTTLTRDLELYKQNYIAAQSVDDQKTAVDVAAAQVNVAQKGLDAANQMVQSALAERGASQDQFDITKKQADADVAVAKAALHSSQQALKFAIANTSQSPAYQANLDALKAQWNAALGTLQASEVLAHDVNLVSPVDGTVTTRALDPGSIAQPGTPVLTIQFMKWVYFNASIPVESSGQVFEGQAAKITLDSLPGQQFDGQIAHVDRSADPTTHQFIVLVKIDNSKDQLRTGMFGHINLVTSHVQAAVTVPREAVTTNPDLTTTVSLVDAKNIAHTTTVKLGVSDALGYQVVSGVSAGDKVVTLAYNPPLKDGKQVQIKAISNPTAGGFGVDTIITKPPAGGSAASSTPTGTSPAQTTPSGATGSTTTKGSDKLMPAGTTTTGSGG